MSAVLMNNNENNRMDFQLQRRIRDEENFFHLFCLLDDELMKSLFDVE